jgi:hypothetical protein
MISIKKIVFYNHGHLGDTFLIKPFVREIIKLLKPSESVFASAYPGEYTSDIVDQHISLESIPISSNEPYIIVEDTLFFNTWFGSCHRSNESDKKNASSDGVLYNFNLFRYCFNATLQSINSDINLDYMLEDDQAYVMDEAYVDFDPSIVPHIHNSDIIKILVYNQIATSGQSDYKDYSNQLDEIVNQNNNIVIYTSSVTSTNNDRIINLNDYCTFPDLFKIAKIAKYCSIISGPCNAPLISSWNKHTLLNDTIKYVVINSNAVDDKGAMRSSNDVGNCIFANSVKDRTIIVNSVDNLFDAIKSLI